MTKIKLIVDGGNMQPGPSVAQQLGPLGVNLGKIITDVNKSTSSFNGIKVPVEINVNPKTKDYEINVFSPPVAELIKKSLQIEKGSGQPKKIKVGNISIESLIGITLTKMNDLLAKNKKSALKLTVGTCASLGVLIDNKEPSEIQIEINSGKYDNEIENQITNASDDKATQLKNFFDLRKAQQEKDIKAAEEAAKVAEEAAAKKVVAVEGEKKVEMKEETKETAKEDSKKPEVKKK